MTKRIIIAYWGALGLPLLILPFVAISASSFYGPMMATGAVAPLFGLILALSRYDVKRGFKTGAIVVRSGVVIVTYFVIFAALAAVSEMNVSPFFKNDSWVLIPLFAPLLTAMTSYPFMKRHQNVKAIHDSGQIPKRKLRLAAGVYFVVLLALSIYNHPPDVSFFCSAAVKKGSSASDASAPGQLEAASSALYDQYPYSPQVIRSIWIDLDYIRPESNTISAVYRSFGNLVTYGKLVTWAGMPVFVKGPHSPDTLNLSSKNDFGYYNKDFVIWMRNSLIPGADDSVFRERTQRLYDLCLRETARSYHIAYVKMKEQPALVDSVKKEYLAAMAANTTYHPDLSNADVEIVPDDPLYPPASDTVKHRKSYRGDVNRLFLFWLRRFIDGTDTEFAIDLEKLLAAYDAEFLARAKSRAY